MCAKCSNCAASFETEDVTLAAQKILSCIYRLAQRNLSMGAAAVCDILHGSKNKKIKSLHLDELSTYGIMSDTPALKIRAVTEGLSDRGYIRRGDYDSLVLTNKAREILFNGEHLSMAFKKSTAESRPKAAAKGKGGRISENPELFEQLRGLRSQLAEEAKVPAYIIFSDATLHDMCAKLPKDDAEFLNVSGVGETKAERYGKEFTELIANYVKENPDCEKSEPQIILSRRQKSQQVGGFDNDTYQKKKLSGFKDSAAVKQLSQISAEIAAEHTLDEKKVERAIESYLIGNGYLGKRQSGIFVTPKGGINGINMSTKCLDKGERVTVIEYRQKARKLIYESLEEILSEI
jgi:ATP-dependent DNA helicase RecQ